MIEVIVNDVCPADSPVNPSNQVQAYPSSPNPRAQGLLHPHRLLRLHLDLDRRLIHLPRQVYPHSSNRNLNTITDHLLNGLHLHRHRADH